MKKIKKIAHLYTLDWQRIFKNPIATFLVIALMILPSLYAWFNIKALWDPYGNTSELPIAVYSSDQATSFQGEEIAIGEEVLAELHDNHELGWQFVDSKKDLMTGVKSGKYYAGVYLPADFSADLLSFTSGEIEKPDIEYYVNEKINAIAPKITDKGASALQEEISQNFIETASSSLMKVFNEIGYDLDANLVSINKVKNMILETNENLDEFDQYTQEVLALNEQMPAIKEKITQAQDFVSYLPQVDELGTQIVALNEQMPALTEQASVILTLQEKLPEVQKAGEQLAMVDEDFAEIEQTMADGISEAQAGLEIITQVQAILPDLKELGTEAETVASATKEGANDLQEALPSIASSVSVTLDSIAEVATTTTSITSTVEQALADNQLTDEEKAELLQIIDAYATSLKNQQTAVTNVISFMEQLQAATGKDSLADIITTLNSANTLLNDLQGRMTTLSEYINENDLTSVQAYLSQVNEVANNVASLVTGIDVSQVTNTVDSLLTEVLTAIETAQGSLSQAQQIDFDRLLSSTKETVQNAIILLTKYQEELPAIKEEIHDANTMLNGHMQEIVDGVNQGAALYQNELPALADQIALAADFMTNDWPSIEAELTSTVTTLDEKFPNVESAVAKASDLIQNDWPDLKSGIQKAASAIQEGEKEVDLGEVIKLLKLDAQKESQFLSSPVNLKTNSLYPIANNGSASTPFYTALCLWVGALLLSSIATTEYFLAEKDQKNYSKRETFVARMLTFVTIALFQALIVTLGNYFILGVDVAQPVWAVLFAMFVAVTFMVIVYVLVALFGNLGKGLAIILLVLSISGGGGNYPIQVSSQFFQVINPLLPFTHAVNLLRESAGGIYWPNAQTACLILGGMLLGFAVLGTWAYPYLADFIQKIEQRAKDSHFIH
ncbi:MAG: YhgE/Pip family protein [Enterococcus sp.]